MTYDAIVIGGGLVGASTAYHLVRAGCKTMLFDRADKGRATNAGAGILSPQVSINKTENWVIFAVKAVNYYPRLVEILASDGALDCGYSVCGMLTVAVDESETKHFNQMLTELKAREAKLGIPTPGSWREIHPPTSAARKYFPPLAEVHRAMFFEGAARVDGAAMATSLLRAAIGHGLHVRNESVNALLLDKEKVTGVTSATDTFSTERVIIAGGAWSPTFGSQLKVEIPIIPQRGQIIHLFLPGKHTDNWPIIEAFRNHYVVPFPGGRVVVGATRETDVGYHPVTTVPGIQEVLNEALRVAPGLHDAEITDVRVGLRPYTRDGLPVLGTIPEVEGIFLATGHGPTGLQLGPYSGKLAADWATGNNIYDDITPFSVARFSSVSV